MRRPTAALLFGALIVSCDQPTDDRPAEPAPPPPSATAEASAALPPAPTAEEPFASLRPRLSSLGTVDACVEVCRMNAHCSGEAVDEKACRAGCSDAETANEWQTRVLQARTCLAGPTCDAYDRCVRGAGLGAP